MKKAKAPLPRKRKLPTDNGIREVSVPNLKNGEHIYEFDLETMGVYEAEYSKETHLAKLQGRIISTRKLLVKPNCAYIRSINVKNAVRKFENQLKKQIDKNDSLREAIGGTTA